MDSCPILAPQIGEKNKFLKEFIVTLDAKDSIPQIEIAITEEQTVLIIRHLEPLSSNDLEKLSSIGKSNNWIITYNLKAQTQFIRYTQTIIKTLTF